MAEYVERCQRYDLFHNTFPPLSQYEMVENSGDVAQNLLPVSFKVLSKLNLEGKKLEFGDVEFPIQLDEKIIIDDVNKILEFEGMKIVQEIEGKLINNLVEKVNEELKEGNTFVVDTMVSRILLYSLENAPTVPIMSIESKYEVKK